MPTFTQRTILRILVSAAMLLPPSIASADFKKTKIAVLDFQLQGESFSSKDMGKIVAEWLITGLVETGRFDVIERRLLEKILEEQKLGVTGAIDPNSAAQLGKILGVKTIVSGTLTSLEGIIEINARLINVDTASIVAAEKVRAGSAGRLNDLVSQITEKIVLAFPLEGYVVQRVGKRVTLDLGRQVGVRPGMRFIAFKEGRVIKHPKTGEVLDVETIEVGEIEITEAREKTATGDVSKESVQEAVSYGTMVRSAIKGQLVNSDEWESQRTPSRSDRAPGGPKKPAIPMPTF
ncbi:MAG: FlgO family outer membrane protein [Nitrospirota bacterium]